MGFATVGCGFLLFAGALVGSDILAGSFKRAVGAGDVDTAVARYRTVRDHAVLGVDLYASRSLARLSFKNASAWPVALEAGRRATQTAEDRQNAFLNLAQLYALQNDAPRAEENIRAAMSAAPNWFKPHWILAELLIRTGRVDEARGQARIAWDLDAGKDAEVVRTWRALGSPR
jgi:tetratricopeptide (TPR) repeat protein